MAKKKKVPDSGWDVFPTEVSNYDDVFEKMTDAAKVRFPGKKVWTGGELAERLVCLRVPALSVRHLLQQEGWPLERFVQIVGPEASFKSSLGYEIIYWHRQALGNGIIIQVEPKPSPEMLLAFLRWDAKAARIHDAHESLEEWFRALRYWVRVCRQAMDGTKDSEGRGRKFPVCFMVDSLTAVLDQALREKFEGDEDPSRHFSTQAAYLSDFMKYLPGKLVGYPFSWVGINHLKEKPSQNHLRPQPERNVPGGKAPRYHETFEIEMKKRGRVKHSDEIGHEVRLTMIKNSLAPEQWLDVERVSWIDLDDRDPVTGHCRSKVMFDWHRASIDVLDQVQKHAGVRIKRELHDLLGLQVTEGRVACAALGISEKKRMDARKAGELLEDRLQADAAFRDALYPLLGIRRRRIFQPGVEYTTQTERAAAEGMVADVDRPEEVQPLPPLPTPEGVAVQPLPPLPTPEGGVA